MITRSEVQIAEDTIKRLLIEQGYCLLSVDEMIWLSHKTGSWDIRKWEGIALPDGIGAV